MDLPRECLWIIWQELCISDRAKLKRVCKFFRNFKSRQQWLKECKEFFTNQNLNPEVIEKLILRKKGENKDVSKQDLKELIKVLSTGKVHKPLLRPLYNAIEAKRPFWSNSGIVCCFYEKEKDVKYETMIQNYNCMNYRYFSEDAFRLLSLHRPDLVYNGICWNDDPLYFKKYYDIRGNLILKYSKNGIMSLIFFWNAVKVLDFFLHYVKKEIYLYHEYLLTSEEFPSFFNKTPLWAFFCCFTHHDIRPEILEWAKSHGYSIWKKNFTFYDRLYIFSLVKDHPWSKEMELLI